MKKILVLLVMALATMEMSAGVYEVCSPNGKVKVTVNTDQGVRWAVNYGETPVLLPSAIDICLQQGQKTLSLGKVGKVARYTVKSSFSTPFYKKATVTDEYGRMLMYTNQKWTIEVRAYDDGAAYRLISGATKPSLVKSETAEFRFADDYQAFVPYMNEYRDEQRYCYSFESYYDEQPLSAMFKDSLAITPLAVCLPGGMKAIVMDAGVENYPEMLVKGDGNALVAEFASYPLEQKVGGFDRLNLIPTKRADYIAKLSPKQSLPWRAVVITERDADILNCDMAQRLAPECRLSDTSWIQPGKVAWDWWNNCNVTGVDFQSGMNTDTYLYYIDFAAKNKIEYIIIDEGWSGKESLMEDLIPEIDLPRLIAYGQKKGVGIILWSSWRNLIGNDPLSDMTVTDKVMKHYADMGIKGFKVDFFDRDDQQVIASAYKVAESAAKYHLYLDYHGLKPFGIQRAYPNILNFEGVKGLENVKWATLAQYDMVTYDVQVPFIRMFAGPMDYTQGAMVNCQKESYHVSNDEPCSQGTRCHQLAMYVTFEAPLQMLADSPTKYMQNQACTDFITRIPTTFDETVAIDGQLGEYTVIARRKGATWYIAAMTDWTERDIDLPLHFLGDGAYQAEIFADGVNALKDATDYRQSRQTVKKEDSLRIHLSSGGGWVAILNQ